MMSKLAASLTSRDGLGLGLYVSYNIIQSLDGCLECTATDSEITFMFEIPVGTVVSLGDSVDTTAQSSRKAWWSDAVVSAAGSKHVMSLRHEIASAASDGLHDAADSYQNQVPSADKKLLNSRTLQIANNRSIRLARVLIVDDSPICRKVLKKHLESNGYTTDSACEGEVISFVNN